MLRWNLKWRLNTSLTSIGFHLRIPEESVKTRKQSGNRTYIERGNKLSTPSKFSGNKSVRRGKSREGRVFKPDRYEYGSQQWKGSEVLSHAKIDENPFRWVIRQSRDLYQFQSVLFSFGSTFRNVCEGLSDVDCWCNKLLF